MKKKFIVGLLALSLAASVSGCGKTDAQGTSSSEAAEVIKATITLGENATVEGSGVVLEGNKVIIQEAGNYSISGTASDGQIVVDAASTDDVEMIFDGVNITSTTSAPVYVKSANNADIKLAEGSENFVTDGANYVLEDEAVDEPNATIFSKDDLTIKGKGSLVVSSNYNNGITSKDDLKIKGGNISVTSVGDGLRGKDSVVVSDGTVTIDAKEDGIKATNIEEAEKGYITVEGGTLNITSVQDAIQAETNVQVTAGTLNLTTGGGSENGISQGEALGQAPGADAIASASIQAEGGNLGQNSAATGASATTETDTVSAKAIKAASNVTIDGGTININSSDDAIHSNNAVVINSGEINVTSGDDGIHSDATLDINGGDVTITKSYEGIESETITFNDGNVNVVATDDGVNAAGGNDGSSVNGRVGQNAFQSQGTGKININGGNLVVDSKGDGVDSNGTIAMTGGVVIVNGPVNDGNGALDYDGTFDLTGGTLIAAGSSGMVQTPSASSTENSVKISLQSQAANTLVHIEDENGEEVMTIAPSKAFSTVVVASDKLKSGSKYNVFVGGESTGTVTDGVYSEGTYSNGTKVGEFTVGSSISTVAQEGAVTGGMGAGGMRVPGERPAMPGQ